MLTNANQPIDDAIRRSCAAADPRQPWARQLEQVAGAALAQGLRLAQLRPARVFSTSGWQQPIDTAAGEFAATARPTALETLRRQTGVAPRDLLAGLVLRHCHHDLAPLSAEQVARYALHLALALADLDPVLAATYRQLTEP